MIYAITIYGEPGVFEALPKERQDEVMSGLDLGLPPLNWSSAMFRKTEEDHGKQTTKARRDCHEVTSS